MTKITGRVMAHSFRHSPHHRRPQKGSTLVELMVGVVIGLLTVGVGIGALMVSRGVSSTVSDASQMQQQAAYAFRVIGQQLRQAGGVAIDPTTGVTDNVQFLPLAVGTTLPVSGKETPASGEYKLSVAYQNFVEPISPPSGSTPVDGYLMRDCLGENPGIATFPLITSQFKLDANKNLVCAGSGAAQPLISGVTDFQVAYLQQFLNVAKQPQFRYAPATALLAADWGNIYAVEVCLELEGSEVIDTAGGTYTKCDGSSASRGNRLRMVFRNIFNIRNHGWPFAGA